LRIIAQTWKQPDQICAIVGKLAVMNRFVKKTIVWGVIDAMEIVASGK